MKPSDEQGVLPLVEGSRISFPLDKEYACLRFSAPGGHCFPVDDNKLVLAAVAAEEHDRAALKLSCVHVPSPNTPQTTMCPRCEAQRAAYRWREWGRRSAT